MKGHNMITAPMYKPKKKEDRPSFDKMNAGINAIVQDYHQMKKEDVLVERYGKPMIVDADALELLRAKAYYFDGGATNFHFQSEEQLLAYYRDRKVK